MIDLSSGALRASCDGLALRWLRWHGVELLRGVAFVVRDAQWGTYAPPVSVVEDSDGPEGRRLSLRATIVEGAARLHCEVELLVAPARILLRGAARAEGDFVTNRTGFVVLHGEGCVGRPVAVEHVDGRRQDGRFPDLISPHQPYFDIAALRHSPHPGLEVTCRMRGESFEMEDHRNWSDAGFKTYCRPLAAPRPFAIRDGEVVRQEVEVTVVDFGATPPPMPEPVVEIGAPRALPRLWRVAPASGDLAGADAVAVERAEDVVALAARAGEAPGFAVLLSEATPAALAAARAAFPQARIAGGTTQNFAEFNRVPPPEGVDAVFWGVSATIHADDDASVMETLRVLGDQARTAAARHPGVPAWAGPIGIAGGWRADPREATAFGAAFLLGQLAGWTAAGVEAVLLPPAALAGDAAKAALLDDLRAGAEGRPLAGPGVVGLRLGGATWLANLTAAPLAVRLDGASVELPPRAATRLAGDPA